MLSFLQLVLSRHRRPPRCYYVNPFLIWLAPDYISGNTFAIQSAIANLWTSKSITVNQDLSSEYLRLLSPSYRQSQLPSCIDRVPPMSVLISCLPVASPFLYCIHDPSFENRIALKWRLGDRKINFRVVKLTFYHSTPLDASLNVEIVHKGCCGSLRAMPRWEMNSKPTSAWTWSGSTSPCVMRIGPNWPISPAGCWFKQVYFLHDATARLADTRDWFRTENSTCSPYISRDVNRYIELRSGQIKQRLEIDHTWTSLRTKIKNEGRGKSTQLIPVDHHLRDHSNRSLRSFSPFCDATNLATRWLDQQ